MQSAAISTWAPSNQGACTGTSLICTGHCRSWLVGCPKLDQGDYSEKLTKIFASNSLASVTVLRMEVPCCGGLGFMLAIVLFASVRERIEFSDYPECFEGFPICLVSAALLALAFMGFSGMKIF